jgi:hypothetical protein
MDGQDPGKPPVFLAVCLFLLDNGGGQWKLVHMQWVDWGTHHTHAVTACQFKFSDRRRGVYSTAL